MRGGAAKLYAVHDLACYPNSRDKFATVGGDGFVCFWDKDQRTRLKNIGPLHSSMSACAFTPDGTHFLASFSYDWVHGPPKSPQLNGVAVMAVGEQMLKKLK